ncbi:MAG TPA: acetyl-CoA carboxylase biotin carboxyl carrier protein subunit [Chloroflexia bacterium]|nr:acetyl-CoA carboxylase biotin carboxyl carrier protein subunit [Chloroflexia bacterium]
MEVKSQISGTVWQVLVEVGQEVSEEEDLIILESMKMEIPVSAPGDGKVAEILVQPNQPVQEGQVLLRIE